MDKEHLESVTIENLIIFKNRTIKGNSLIKESLLPRYKTIFDKNNSYGWCKGNFALGINPLGQYVVKTPLETFTFNNPSEAVEKYIEIIVKK